MIQSNPLYSEQPPFLVKKSVIYRHGDKMVFELFLDADRVMQIDTGAVTCIPALCDVVVGIIRTDLHFCCYLHFKMATIGSKVAMKHYKLAKKNADARAAGSETSLPSFGNAKQLVVVKIGYKDFVHAQFFGSISMEPRFDGDNFYFALQKKH